MSSVKDMISRLNSSKAKAPAVSVDNPVAAMQQNKSENKDTGIESEDNSTNDLPKAAKRMSISDRIASLKASGISEQSPAPIQPLKKAPTIPERTTTVNAVDSTVNETATADAAVAANKSGSFSDTSSRRLSISDRIAALKAAGPSTSETPRAPIVIPRREPPPPVPKAVTEAPTFEAPDILNNSVVSDQQVCQEQPPVPVVNQEITNEIQPPSPVIERETTVPSSSSSQSQAATNPVPPAEKRGSIADRIAVMQAKPDDNKTEEKPKITPTKSAGIASKIAAMQSQTSPPPPPPQTVKSSEVSPIKTGGSIAERLAMLSKAEGNSATTDDAKQNGSEEAPTNSGSTPSKRLSIDRVKFGQGINLAGFNPMAPRPMMIVPKSKPSEEETENSNAPSDKKSSSSVAENGEFQHLNLSRAAIPSMRRKATQSVRLTQTIEFDDGQTLSLPSYVEIIDTTDQITTTTSVTASVAVVDKIKEEVDQEEDGDEGTDQN